MNTDNPLMIDHLSLRTIELIRETAEALGSDINHGASFSQLISLHSILLGTRHDLEDEQLVSELQARFGGSH